MYINDRAGHKTIPLSQVSSESTADVFHRFLGQQPGGEQRTDDVRCDLVFGLSVWCLLGYSGLDSPTPGEAVA